MRVLLVRLGALGDIVHTLPVAAALRRTFPAGRIDWAVAERNRELVSLVPVVDAVCGLGRRGLAGSLESVRVLRQLRAARYDVALDVQGLVKSAVVARLSGARRVIGFSDAHLREPLARALYTEQVDPGPVTHVILRNLGALRQLGATPAAWEFPLAFRPTGSAVRIRRALGLSSSAPFVVINPGAAWRSKRWPPRCFGAVAAWLSRRSGVRSGVLWGPGEESLAQEVAAASEGAAGVAPRTTIADLVDAVRAAALVVSGDTLSLHLAAAVGTPVVGIYGPTDPARNGPWSPDDVTVARFGVCGCHHQRRCRRRAWCLADIGIDEVTEAVERRLSIVSRRSPVDGRQSG